jgi:hypothetical protein
VETAIDVAKKLHLSEIQKTGMAFSTGQWHPGVKRFGTDLPGLVETLRQEGQLLGGMLNDCIKLM